MILNRAQQIKIYRELCEKINIMFNNEYLNEKDCIEDIINKSASDSYYINSFVASIGIDYSLKAVSDYKLKKIINHKIDGQLWSDRLWDNKKSLRADMKLQVKKFLNGETNVNEISNILEKKYKNNKYITTRLVNDNIAHVQEEANKVWKHNHNIATDLYMGTLDYKICDKCKPYDGKTFSVDEGPQPPLHVGCRCTRVAIPNESWRLSKRLDNETKERVDWQSYEEWLDKLEQNQEVKITKKDVNNDYSVYRKLVNSKEYHNKFEGLPLNKSANENLYMESKRILEHRDGTYYEDLVVLDF